MAWEISHAPEVWDDLRLTMQMMYSADPDFTHRYLTEALAHSDNQGQAEMGEYWPDYLEGRMHELRKLPQDVIANSVIEQIEKTNTTDNGGHHFWIDPAGWYKIAPAKRL